jgi:adenylate kinase family enzyme
VGLAGSGKTTLANDLSKKYGVKYYSTDDMLKKFDWNDFIKKITKLINSPERKIIEGVSILGFMYPDSGEQPIRKKVLSFPTVILGSSLVKSNFRRFLKHKNFKRVVKNFKVFNNKLEQFRKDLKRSKMSEPKSGE